MPASAGSGIFGLYKIQNIKRQNICGLENDSLLNLKLETEFECKLKKNMSTM